ncbi:MAG: WD40 repeat domain-containing serine/threonine protein kinase [Ktedonobacteraceae bacterium]
MADRGGREGQQLGNYRLIHLLGQGGFADVYLGEHIYLDTPAAIKLLHTQLASDEVESFRAEARTIARLVHPHIVRVLDYGLDGTTPFLVIDYAPNGTLRKRHPRGVPLPLSTIVSYVTQLADALQYAHEQKVIHRDVKPENMLLGRRNEVLLSDFGIALVAQSSHYHSTQSIQDLAGTIAYMAPEQIQSQAVPNSDQYSLGIVVYEWLCGTRPFQGAFAEIAVKQTLVAPPSLREKIPTLSPAIEEVAMKVLAKDPKQRFVDVKAFAAALEEAYQKEPASPVVIVDGMPAPSAAPSSPAETIALSNQEGAPATPAPPAALLTAPIVSSQAPTTESLSVESPPSSAQTPALDKLPATPLPPRSPRRRVSRRTALVGLAGLAIASAVGGGIALLTRGQVSPGILAPHSNGEGATLYTFLGHSDQVWSVAWSPDGKRIASASSDETAQVWDATDGNHLNVYLGHSDSVYAVGWSPDGMRIASGSYDKTVQIWDATYGDHFYTYTGHSSWVWSVAWSPDGKRIASAGGDTTVQLWDATSGHRFYTYTGHSASVYAVAWSPDGKHIASASSDGMVQVWDAATGDQIYTYQPYSSPMWSVGWSPDSKRISSASSEGTVQVWDAVNGGHLYIYYGHSDFVRAVAWSPDGKRIASAGDDRTVQLWDAAYGANPYTYSGHSNSVRTVAWSPDSKRIASGSWDKTVQVWKAV